MPYNAGEMETVEAETLCDNDDDCKVTKCSNNLPAKCVSNTCICPSTVFVQNVVPSTN